MNWIWKGGDLLSRLSRCFQRLISPQFVRGGVGFGNVKNKEKMLKKEGFKGV
jgi:hypothetical protein